MGIDLPQFQQLTALSARWRPQGRSLMLGRQALRATPTNGLRLTRALKAAGHGIGWRDVVQQDGFSETMWARLGFGAIETMDLSPYEGAGHVHDLNRPVPRDLHGQFAFIFDGGTLEHVFDVPQALRNVFDMLAPGGRFVSVNGMNGWVGHGFYQFNPDLVWTFWQRGAGCVVHGCMGLPRDVPGLPIPFADTALTGRRLRLGGKLPEGRIYLYYEIEKPEGATLGDTVLQSDYRARWAEAEEKGATL